MIIKGGLLGGDPVGEGVERVIGSEYDLNTLYTYV
jgi:hypothetical protein